jgi:hypothetical protein
MIHSEAVVRRRRWAKGAMMVTTGGPSPALVTALTEGFTAPLGGWLDATGRSELLSSDSPTDTAVRQGLPFRYEARRL